MLVEYALRFSASTISSVAATSAFRITSNEIGSIDALPPPVDLARPLGARPCPRARRAATRSGSRSAGGP